MLQNLEIQVDLITKLATTCVTAMQKNAEAPTPSDIREKFESSKSREGILRRHANRLLDLSKSRAEEEDTSPAGYVDTFGSRLLPVPQTGAEAVIRLPLIGAGGVAGYHAGKEVEPLDSKKLYETLAPKATGGKPDQVTAFEHNLYDFHQSGKPEELVKKLRKFTPEELSSALRKRDVPFIAPSDRIKNIRNLINSELGPEGVSIFRREAENIIRQSAGKGTVVPTIMENLRPYRLGGIAGGLAAGSVLTGLPLALRAMYLKQYGGEAANRARGSMDEALGQANSESAKREELLSQLPQEQLNG
jgi:hypothetical protein